MTFLIPYLNLKAKVRNSKFRNLNFNDIQTIYIDCNSHRPGLFRVGREIDNKINNSSVQKYLLVYLKANRFLSIQTRKRSYSLGEIKIKY